MTATKNIFKGKTVAEAIENACKSLKVSQEQLDIEVLNTGSSGIFGLIRPKSTIKATLKKKEKAAASSPARPSPKKKTTEKKKPVQKPDAKKSRAPQKAQGEKEEAAAFAEPSPDSTPAKESFSIPESDQETIRADIEKLLELMQFSSDVSISFEEGTLLAHIKGAHVDDIIGEEGRTLDSLQYLLRKMLRKKFPYKINLNLDAGEFRANRLEDLKKLSHKLAAEVKETGKTRSISSLNPSERRVIHLELQEEEQIKSRSVGEGLFKKVLIYPAGKGKKSAPRKRRSPKQTKA
jgi:spoIIIJ-associated protein